MKVYRRDLHSNWGSSVILLLLHCAKKKEGKILICNFERVSNEKLKTELALEFHPKNTPLQFMNVFSYIS